MGKYGPMNTPYEDCAATPPSPKGGDEVSFGQPISGEKAAPSEDSLGGGVQFANVKGAPKQD